jgi:NADPH:quinone reductase
VIDAVGEESRWAVGDRVAGVTVPGAEPLAGAYASRAILADDSLVHLPAGTSYAAGSTLLMNGLTALRAIDLARLRPGATLGVTGGAGAVGGYVIQLAAAQGLRVVADALPRDRGLIRGLGAEEVVMRGPGVAQRFVTAMKGPLDAVIDAAVVGPLLLGAVKHGGFFGILRPVDWTSERGIEARLVVGVEYARDAGKLDHLRRCLEAGSLSLRVAATYPPEQAADAHRELEAGGVRGRLVLEWSTINV